MLAGTTAAVAAPSEELIAQRIYDAKPKDAPLKSLFPEEPKPPAPVRCHCPSNLLSTHIYSQGKESIVTRILAL